MKTLDFSQLWFEEKQIQHLYAFAKPYYNELITPYFENAIIADIVSKSNADLIGIASWQLRKKRMSLPVYRQLQAGPGTDLTHEKIINSFFDVAILLPMPVEHRMLTNRALSFGKIWGDSFKEMASFLRDKLGMVVPEEISLPVYGNHFVARREIYKAYVSECLVPVIEYMNFRQDIFWQNSDYVTAKANNSGIDSVQGYKVRSGRDDWPIAPFLLETLFSLWMERKKLNITII